MRAVGAEIEPHPVLAAERARRLRRLALLGPSAELGQDVARDDLGPRLPPVLPWEEAVPGFEARARRPRRIVGRARQGEIADRDHMRVGVAGLGVPAAVAEGVELLDIAEPQAGLFFHPGPQPDLEGAVRDRVERSERKTRKPVAVAAGRRQDQGLVAFQRDDRRGEADLDRRQRLLAYLAR